MSANATIERLQSAVEEAAGLLDIDCPPDRIRPLLTTFQDAFVSAVVLNIVTSGGRIEDLSFDFAVPTGLGDPYALALSCGLAEETDHPVRALLADLRARLPVQTYGVDFGITGGFKKAYASFPLGELQGLAELAAVPSMPPALGEHLDSFAKYGLDGKVSAVAIDYAHRTWNVYFNGLSAEHVEREAVLSMIGEFGLPAPSAQLLDFIGASSAFYPTFGWDSSKVERLSFSAKDVAPTALPARIAPTFAKFAGGAPYTYQGERVIVYAGALSPSEEYYKLAAYYQLSSKAHDRFRSES